MDRETITLTMKEMRRLQTIEMALAGRITNPEGVRRYAVGPVRCRHSSAEEGRPSTGGPVETRIVTTVPRGATVSGGGFW